ncbi:MAG: response regulator transcription factor [Bacteroidota bacterium]
MKPISIILADDQYLIRLGLRHLLNGFDSFRIVGEASHPDVLFDEIKQKQPDVVILDHMQAIEINADQINRYKQVSPRTKLLVISADNDKSSIYSVLETGINSFLTKECDKEEIINAINATAKGEKFFCGKVLDFLLEKSFAPDPVETASSLLTDRQIEIVRMVANGKIAKEIASELNLSTHTVYTHRKNIMKKLNINSASELVIYAVKNGMM